MNRLQIGRISRRLTQQLAFRIGIRERALFQIERDKCRSQSRHGHVPRLELVLVALGKACRIGVSHIVDQINLTGPQRSQTHLVDLFRTPFNAFQIR